MPSKKKGEEQFQSRLQVRSYLEPFQSLGWGRGPSPRVWSRPYFFRGELNYPFPNQLYVKLVESWLHQTRLNNLDFYYILTFQLVKTFWKYREIFSVLTNLTKYPNIRKSWQNLRVVFITISYKPLELAQRRKVLITSTYITINRQNSIALIISVNVRQAYQYIDRFLSLKSPEK